MKLLWRDTTPHARIAKQRIRTLRQLDTQIKELTTEIAELVTQTRTRLLDIHGVGVLVAATVLSEVGNPTRYSTKNKFAMANGTAPIEASSGRVVRHRLNRGGNRQLNRAIHTAALTQIARTDTEGRHYYQKLITRGKTHREALPVLKRRISDRIWTHLQPPKTSPQFDIGPHQRRRKRPLSTTESHQNTGAFPHRPIRSKAAAPRRQKHNQQTRRKPRHRHQRLENSPKPTRNPLPQPTKPNPLKTHEPMRVICGGVAVPVEMAP